METPAASTSTGHDILAIRSLTIEGTGEPRLRDHFQVERDRHPLTYSPAFGVTRLRREFP